MNAGMSEILALMPGKVAESAVVMRGRYTALHRASFACDVGTVGLLLDAGADANAKTAWGGTPLTLALLFDRSAGPWRTKTAARLLEVRALCRRDCRLGQKQKCYTSEPTLQLNRRSTDGRQYHVGQVLQRCLRQRLSCSAHSCEPEHIPAMDCASDDVHGPSSTAL